MVKLKQLTCSIELGPSKTKLQEYGHNYRDGYVECFVPVIDVTIPFVVHVQSSGYIAPGLAVFIYMDGQYQCNRNITGLQMPRDGASKTKTDADFYFRQKEEKTSKGAFVGRDWTFAQLKTAVADEAPSLNPQFLHNVGTIEVVVLRCAAHDREAMPRTARVTAVATSTKKPSSSKTVAIRAVTPAASVVTGLGIMGGIFDGANDERETQFVGKDGTVNLPPGYKWDFLKGEFVRTSPSVKSTKQPADATPQNAGQNGRDGERKNPPAGATIFLHQNVKHKSGDSHRLFTESSPPSAIGDTQFDGYGRFPDHQPAHGRYQYAPGGYQQPPFQQGGFQQSPFMPAYTPQPAGYGGYGPPGQAYGQPASHNPQQPAELEHLRQLVYKAERERDSIFNQCQEAGRANTNADLEEIFKQHKAARQRVAAAQRKYNRAVREARNVPGQGFQQTFPPNAFAYGQAHEEMDVSDDEDEDQFWVPGVNPPGNAMGAPSGNAMGGPPRTQWLGGRLRHQAPAGAQGFHQVGEGVFGGPFSMTKALNKDTGYNGAQEKNSGGWGNPSTVMHGPRKHHDGKKPVEQKEEAKKWWDDGHGGRKQFGHFHGDDKHKPGNGPAVKKDNDWPQKQADQPKKHNDNGGGGWSKGEEKSNDDSNGWGNDNGGGDWSKNQDSSNDKSNSNGWNNNDRGSNQTPMDKQASNGWGSGSKSSKREQNDEAWKNDSNSKSGGAGWGSKDQQHDNNNNNGVWGEATPGKNRSVATPSSRASSHSSVTPESIVKTYWNQWRGGDLGSETPKKRVEPRPVYQYPAPPPPFAPLKVKNDANFGVQVGKGADYAHKNRKPQYMDTMDAPYAVFSFKYRSKDVLEQRLKITVETDMADVVAQAEKDRLMQLPKDKLVEELLKARTPLKGGEEATSEADAKSSQKGGKSEAESKKSAGVNNNGWGSGGDDKGAGWGDNADTPAKASKKQGGGKW